MSKDDIRLANDTFRLHHSVWGRLMITSGVSALGPAFVAKAIYEVRVFDKFNNGNDPSMSMTSAHSM